MKKRECVIVQEGDTLSGIAAKYCGSCHDFTKLWEINCARLRGRYPGEIYPGEIILLPYQDDCTDSKHSKIEGITVRDLINRGIGFRAGAREVFFGLGRDPDELDDEVQRTLREYIQSVIAAHKQS